MKMRHFVIGMSIVMSFPVVAMHRHVAASSYKTPALIGGSIAATYGVVWAYDFYRSLVDFFEPFGSKLSDTSKIYNWCLDQYSVDKPIELVPQTSAHNHRAVADGRKQVLNSDPLLDQLMNDFSSLPHADSTLVDALYEKIQSEKKELLENIDTLVKETRYFFNWYNIRKTYKHLCTQHLSPAKTINVGSLQPTDQKQWTHVQYEKMQEPMANAAQTNLYHLMIGKITYGQIARLYWQFLTRYYRLERIAHRLESVVSVDLKNRYKAEWEQIVKERNKREEIEDQVLGTWLYEKSVKPVREWYSAFFAS